MHSLMIDNWTLQDVRDLLSEGLDDKTGVEITISSDRQTHQLQPVNMGVHQIDALLTLLTNIVCCERLLVDKELTYAWANSSANFLRLTDSVVEPTDYSPLGEQLQKLRDLLVNELCVTPTLAADIKLLQSTGLYSESTPTSFLTMVVSRGAGMLARSHLSGYAYFGHPVRRKLIKETRIFSPNQSAVEQLTSFLNTGRSKMFRYRGNQLSGTLAQFSLPPISVQIIEEASCIDDLIPIALQMRDKHQNLREWLGEYQIAIDEEDERKQLKFEKKLASVARALETSYGATKSGSTGVSLSAGWFRFDLPSSLADRAMNSFGIRAILTNLLLTSRGHHALSKLLKFLDAEHTALGRDIDRACRARYSAE